MSDNSEFKPPPFFYPVECDFLNPVASFRQSVKEGNHYYVRFEVTPELWRLFEEPDPGLHLKGPLYRVHDDASDSTPDDNTKAKEKPKREKKPAKESGSYGKYWQAMFKHGALNHPGLREALKMPDDLSGEQAVKEHLRAQFAVDSLTFIPPSSFEAFCDDGNHPVDLTSLITISRQAEAEAST